MTDFLDLPSQEDFPDYYEAIGLPMSLNGIEAKLKRNAYPTLSTLEGDLRRLVSNAKNYNQKNSSIYSDAERIRKIVAAFMVQNNPVYKQNPKAVVPPTPVPERVVPDGEDEETLVEAEKVEAEQSPLGGRRGSRRSTSKPVPSRVTSSTPVVEHPNSAGQDFKGDTFQTAQEKIITELITLKDEDGDEFTAPFHNKPDRQLYKSYYDIIKHPVSLKGIQRQVRGIEGKKPATGVSFFISWKAFEEETAYVWRNAKEYNEDGSEISVAADKIEAYFDRRVAEAKKFVPEPAQPSGGVLPAVPPRLKIKLNASKTPEPSPKIKLRLSGRQSETPGSPGAIKSNSGVDNEAPKGQSEFGTTHANGYRDVAPSTTRSTSRKQSESVEKAGTAHIEAVLDSKTGSATPAPISGTKEVDSEQDAEASQAALTDAEIPRPTSSSMPPPNANGISRDSNHVVTVTPKPAAPLIVSPMDNKWRKPGKGVQDALIKNVGLDIAWRRGTFPAPVPRKRWEIAASPILTQQSFTFHIPYVPNTVCELAVSIPGTDIRTRQVQLFFLKNFHQIPYHRNEMLSRPSHNINAIRLDQGLNRVEVVAIAGPPRGAPRSAIPSEDIDYERFLLLFNVVKDSS